MSIIDFFEILQAQVFYFYFWHKVLCLLDISFSNKYFLNKQSSSVN